MKVNEDETGAFAIRKYNNLRFVWIEFNMISLIPVEDVLTTCCAYFLKLNEQ